MPDANLQKLVLFGVGQTAQAVRTSVQARNLGLELWGTTRSPDPQALRAVGINPILLPGEKEILKAACRDAFVLISFPPDGQTDRLYFDIVCGARKIVYISSTAVYGGTEGVIDESSPTERHAPRAAARLDAEELWLSAGAVILRAPALYGPESGLHKRLISGDYRLPGDGSNFVSRIHLDDLAAIVIELFLKNEFSNEDSARTFVVGDLKPSTHIEVVTWLCKRLSLPLPETAPLSQVNASMTGNRRIKPDRILNELGIELIYPTYVEGFTQCLAKM